jgi:hypothetical protein
LSAQGWAVDAARRVDALGLAPPDFAWGDGSLTRIAVGRVLYEAIARAHQERPALESTIAGYWDRFTTEFPATAARVLDDTNTSSAPLEGLGRAGYSRQTGRLYVIRTTGGRGTPTLGPFPRPDLSEADALLSASVLSPYFAAQAEVEHQDQRFTAGESHALLGWKSIAIWGGRRAPAFGPGVGGGLLFSGTAHFTGGGIALTEPVRLPSFLSHIGAFRFESFLSELDSNAAIRHPWLVASHLSLTPHPRFLIGLTQTFMFGGDGVQPFTWSTFKSLYFGHGKLNSNSPDISNGLLSAELRFRPPIALSPVLYLEMGTEDNQGAWHVVPANITGIRFPYVRGLPSLSLGAEHTYFSSPCTTCNYYATWYRHYLFNDGWTLDRQPIGHELGGDGYEWLGYATWDDSGQRYRVDARAFHRYRGAYNLYSPLRAGESTGGRVGGTWRFARQLELRLDGTVEATGSGVKSSALYAGGQLNF